MLDHSSESAPDPEKIQSPIEFLKKGIELNFTPKHLEKLTKYEKISDVSALEGESFTPIYSESGLKPPIPQFVKSYNEPPQGLPISLLNKPLVRKFLLSLATYIPSTNQFPNKYEGFKEFAKTYLGKTNFLDNEPPPIPGPVSPTMQKALKGASALCRQFARKEPEKFEKLFKILSDYHTVHAEKKLVLFVASAKKWLKEIQSGQAEYLSVEVKARRALAEITSQTLISAYLRNSDPDFRNDVVERYQSFARADNLHYARNDPRHDTAFAEVVRIHRRGHTYHEAFSPLQFLARRNPNNDTPHLAQFGQDCADRVTVLHSGDRNRMPAGGYAIYGLKNHRLYLASGDPSSPEPFAEYKAAWPELASDFGKTATARYIFTRGMMLVSNSDDERHFIQIHKGGTRVPFTLVICNDHFGGSDAEHCGEESIYLVPTAVINEALFATETDLTDYVGPDKTRRDINEAGFSIPAFRERAGRYGLPVLHIGSGATFAGGFTNAWQPHTKWFYPNEQYLLENFGGRVYDDAWGHAHKGDITGTYTFTLNAEAREKLKDFPAAHDDVVRASNSLFSQLDLFFIGLGQWSKGLTAGDQVAPVDEEAYFGERDDRGQEYEREPDDTFWRSNEEQALPYDDRNYGEESSDTSISDYKDEVDEYNGDQLDEEFPRSAADQSLARSSDPADLLNNPNITRMLYAAYAENTRRFRTEEGQQEQYPVYAMGEDTELWSITPSPFYLDSYDMTLHVGSTTFKLPPMNSDGTLPDEAIDLWKEFVAPHFFDSLTIRPYHREDLRYHLLNGVEL